MKKVTLTIFIALALVVATLPIMSTQAQTRRRSATDPGQYHTSAAKGTPEYYNDDNVRYSAIKNVRVARTEYQFRITGDPQVKGGVTTAPLDDEEDVDNDRVRPVEMMSGSGKMYLGELPLTLADGTTKVRIRRKKKTHKLLVVLNCGNWARELGVGIESSVEYTTEKCVKHDPITTHPADLEGFDSIEVVDDGCTVTITKIKTITNTECVPDSWFVRIQDGPSQGKLNGKKTTVKSHIQDPRLLALFEAQYPGLGDMKVQFFQLLEEACVPKGGIAHLKIVALVSSGGGWSWKSFIIGLAVGAVIGFFAGRSSVDCPRIVGSKVEDIPPGRGPGGTGGLFTSGGGILGQVGKPERQ